MRLEDINIATARIKGLSEKPVYDKEHSFYTWKLQFEDTFCLNLKNLIINAGNLENEAINLCSSIKNNFEKAQIKDGNMIVLIYNKDNEILAIRPSRYLTSDKTIWIDAIDNFSLKSFDEVTAFING